MKETSGGHLGPLWEASGRALGIIWESFRHPGGNHKDPEHPEDSLFWNREVMSLPAKVRNAETLILPFVFYGQITKYCELHGNILAGSVNGARGRSRPLYPYRENHYR